MADDEVIFMKLAGGHAELGNIALDDDTAFRGRCGHKRARFCHDYCRTRALKLILAMPSLLVDGSTRYSSMPVEARAVTTMYRPRRCNTHGFCLSNSRHAMITARAVMMNAFSTRHWPGRDARLPPISARGQRCAASTHE